MLTFRGRPPRGLDLAGGISSATIAHCSSVRSDGYFFRTWPSCTMSAHSCIDGLCANYLSNLLFCQDMFPDSLSEEREVTPPMRNCLKHRTRLLTEKSLRRRCPVGPGEEKVVHGSEALPLPRQVESAPLMVAERQVAVAPLHLGTRALEHSRQPLGLVMELILSRGAPCA